MRKRKNHNYLLIIGLGGVIGILLYQQRFTPWFRFNRDIVQEVYQELNLNSNINKREGMAIALLIDSSGSMANAVRDLNNTERPKIDITRETAKKVILQIKKFKDINQDKEVRIGIYSFGGDEVNGIKTILNMGTVAPSDIDVALNQLNAFGNTPLGEAIMRAKKEMDRTGLNKEHIIIISDGLNTIGRLPVEVIRGIRQLPADAQPVIYLITFDVKADLFNDLKKETVLVLEAGNAKELNQTIDFILHNKILVEQPL